jgi:hypothetical protein
MNPLEVGMVEALRASFERWKVECEGMLRELEQQEQSFQHEVLATAARYGKRHQFQPNQMIKLDIGGHKYNTTLAGLAAKAGFFRVLAHGYVPLELDSEGCIFIDRSGNVFR